MTDLNLDVDAPEKVAEALLRVANAYSYISLDLASAWQDREAGKVWEKIADELFATAERINKIVTKS
jgi:hypothetical protein